MGLTGSIACGKSTVSKYLSSQGAVIVDADQIARAIVQPGAPVYKKIVAHFGPTVLQEGDYPEKAAGGLPPLNRAALRERISQSKADKKFLDGVTHPAILKTIFQQ